MGWNEWEITKREMLDYYKDDKDKWTGGREVTERKN